MLSAKEEYPRSLRGRTPHAVAETRPVSVGTASHGAIGTQSADVFPEVARTSGLKLVESHATIHFRTLGWFCWHLLMLAKRRVISSKYHRSIQGATPSHSHGQQHESRDTNQLILPGMDACPGKQLKTQTTANKHESLGCSLQARSGKNIGMAFSAKTTFFHTLGYPWLSCAKTPRISNTSRVSRASGSPVTEKKPKGASAGGSQNWMSSVFAGGADCVDWVIGISSLKNLKLSSEIFRVPWLTAAEVKTN